MDEDRRTDPDQRGDALTSRTDPADGEDARLASGSEPLPDALRGRLDSCAADWIRDRTRLALRQSRLAWFAAAACFALALAGWWPRLVTSPTLDGSSRVAQLSAELSRDHLISSRGDALTRWSWSSAAGSAPGLRGDVVWDPSQQRGYLRFEGLEPNAPARHQYQLWIVDASRDARYPVDGGVFDVASRGPVVIPVRAAVPVREPVAFVVTVERPGGTVVSSREHVVAVARSDAH